MSSFNLQNHSNFFFGIIILAVDCVGISLRSINAHFYSVHFKKLANWNNKTRQKIAEFWNLDLKLCQVESANWAEPKPDLPHMEYLPPEY